MQGARGIRILRAACIRLTYSAHYDETVVTRQFNSAQLLCRVQDILLLKHANADERVLCQQRFDPLAADGCWMRRETVRGWTREDTVQLLDDSMAAEDLQLMSRWIIKRRRAVLDPFMQVTLHGSTQF